MDTNNKNYQNYGMNEASYNYTYDLENADIDYDIYSSRYDRRFDRRFDRRLDRRFDRSYPFYPYCDRYGRCENPIWWLFWPFFFL